MKNVGQFLILILLSLLGILLISLGVNILFDIDQKEAFNGILCIVAGIEFVWSCYTYKPSENE